MAATRHQPKFQPISAPKNRSDSLVYISLEMVILTIAFIILAIMMIITAVLIISMRGREKDDRYLRNEQPGHDIRDLKTGKGEGSNVVDHAAEDTIISTSNQQEGKKSLGIFDNDSERNLSQLQKITLKPEGNKTSTLT